MNKDITPFWEVWWQMFLVDPVTATLTGIFGAVIIIIFGRVLFDTIREMFD